VAAIVKCGHDVAGHGYVQDELLAYLAPEEEKRTIRRCLDISKRLRASGRLAGSAPYWLSPNTRARFWLSRNCWHGDARDTDLPHATDTKAGPSTFRRATSPTIARCGAVRWRCHNGGRPLVTSVFDKIFRYMAQFPDVWFASYGEIARWVLDTRRDAATHARRLIDRDYLKRM
jgi:hypothetical protein